jgi:PAS domain S-box-containing protein
MDQNNLTDRIWHNPKVFPPDAILRELENLLRSNPDLWLKFTVDGVIVDYKPSRYLNFGKSPQEFIGKQLWEGLPSYLSKIAEEAISYLSERKNQVFWKEYEYQTEHHTRHAEVRFVMLYNGYIVSTHRDITERKRLEAAFLESESRFLSMAQNAADSIVILNEDGMIQFFNKAAEKSFGYEQASVLNQTVDLILPIEENTSYINFRDYFSADSIFSNDTPKELVARRKNESVFSCELSIGEFKTNSGMMYTGIIRDITVRRLQEQEIFHYRNHLEELVEKQTRDLKIAKEVAEEASYMKSLFLANISHELKTPIHAILSYAELGNDKAKTATPEKIQEYFQIIDSSGKRLLDLLENLLDLAKLESGKMKYVFEPNCLKDTLKHVTSEMSVIMNKKQIHVNIDEAEYRWEAEFDLERIQQVIRNILSNALKFIPENTNIEIKKINSEFIPLRKTQYVKGIGIQIRDFGPGIPPEDLDKIFEKFIQSKQVKAGTKGTGLGLSISREIVNDHHGLLYADNHEDGGAVFTLLLPIKQGDFL